MHTLQFNIIIYLLFVMVMVKSLVGKFSQNNVGSLGNVSTMFPQCDVPQN